MSHLSLFIFVPSPPSPPPSLAAVAFATKMEMVVNAAVGGKVKAIHVDKGHKLEGQDLMMEIE